MTLRSDWKTDSLRRNYRRGAVIMTGAPRIARRAGSSRAWQRDASRGVSRLLEKESKARERATHRSGAPATQNPHRAWKRLEARVRAVLTGLRWTDRTPIDAAR